MLGPPLTSPHRGSRKRRCRRSWVRVPRSTALGAHTGLGRTPTGGTGLRSKPVHASFHSDTDRTPWPNRTETNTGGLEDLLTGQRNHTECAGETGHKLVTLKKISAVKLGISKTTLQNRRETHQKTEGRGTRRHHQCVLTPLCRSRTGKEAVCGGQNGKHRALLSTADPSSRRPWMKGQSTWVSLFWFSAENCLKPHIPGLWYRGTRSFGGPEPSLPFTQCSVSFSNDLRTAKRPQNFTEVFLAQTRVYNYTH